MEKAAQAPAAGLEVRGFERVRASLIAVSGEHAGEEHPVDRPRWLLGRGPGVDAAIADPALHPCHAAIEFARGSFYLTDLSGAGAEVNGQPVGVERCELVHGDRIALGGQVFQLLID